MRPSQQATASEPPPAPPPPRISTASAWAEPRRRPPASVASDNAPSTRSPARPAASARESTRAVPALGDAPLIASRSSRRFQPQLQGLHRREVAQLQEPGGTFQPLQLREPGRYTGVIRHVQQRPDRRQADKLGLGQVDAVLGGLGSDRLPDDPEG